MKDFKILLVEDDQVDVMNVRRAFKRSGFVHELHTASNGLEALQMLRGENRSEGPLKPSVILLDLNMPLMNGFEFLHEIRADQKLKPLQVFVLTTSDKESDRNRAYAYNVAGYIVKPLDLKRFSQVMEALKDFWEICEFD